MQKNIGEISDTYLERLAVFWPQMAIAAAAVLLVCLIWRYAGPGRNPAKPLPRFQRRLPLFLLIAALGIGLHVAWSRASIVDDAYISFRFARNLVQGQGLVFNPGEYVEGYTNFLWTVLLAALLWITGIELPVLSVICNLVCFAANLVVVYLIGKTLLPDPRPRVYVPIAVLLLAVQSTFTEFATSGLETMMAGLLINLGVLFMVRRANTANALLAGSAWILATMTRPDCSMFYALGGLIIGAGALADWYRAGRKGRDAWASLLTRPLAFAIPLIPFALCMLWKYSYYGSLLPNTYYAKSAGEVYIKQGVIFFWTFFLASHYWVVYLLWILWILFPFGKSGAARFKWFSAGAVLLYNMYVLKVGGDFMFGRFYHSLIPLLLLAMEQLVYRVLLHPERIKSRSPTWACILVAVMLAASARGVNLFEAPKRIRWGIACEGTVYEMASIDPVRIRHHSFTEGRLFGKALYDRGIRPVIATGGIGMIGYYSRLEVIDLRGLTDATIAHRPIDRRGRPGHEKFPTREYLHQRNVKIIRWRGAHPPRYRRLASLRLGRGTSNHWFVFVYDRDIMRRIRDESPEIRFTDFEKFLDVYIENLPGKKRDAVQRDLKWFRAYYFDHNHDPERLRPLEAYIEGDDSG